MDWTKVNEELAKRDYNGETSKAHERRLREGWFERYAPSDRSGIDIGCQFDPINETFRRFDWVFGDGDATIMEGVSANTYHTVYASHILEHLQFPHKAIQRWYEIVEPGGHLIICVPSRDLYEKKRFPPSNWNPEHVYFWLPEVEEPPCTKSLKHEVLRAIPDADIVSLRVLDSGYDYSLGADEHPVGEYGIEIIVKKRGL
jgi:SAM-dependent methyltransferase